MQVTATPVCHRRFTQREQCMLSRGLIYEPVTAGSSLSSSFSGVAVLDTNKSQPAVAYLGGQETKKYFPVSGSTSVSGNRTVHFYAGSVRGHVVFSHKAPDGGKVTDTVRSNYWLCEATVNQLSLDIVGSSNSSSNPTTSSVPVTPQVINFSKAFDHAVKELCKLNSGVKDLVVLASEIYRLRDGRDVVGTIVNNCKDHSLYVILVQLDTGKNNQGGCRGYGFAVPAIHSVLKHQLTPLLMQTGNFFSLVIPHTTSCVCGGIAHARSTALPCSNVPPADKPEKLKTNFALTVFCISLAKAPPITKGKKAVLAQQAAEIELAVSASPSASKKQICVTPVSRGNLVDGAPLNIIGCPTGHPVVGFAFRAENSTQVQLAFIDILSPKTGTTVSAFSQPEAATLLSVSYHAPRQVLALLDDFGALNFVQRWGGAVEFSLKKDTQWGMRYGAGKSTALQAKGDAPPVSAGTKVMFSYDDSSDDGKNGNKGGDGEQQGGKKLVNGKDPHADLYCIEFIPSPGDLLDPSSAGLASMKNITGPLLYTCDGKYSVVFCLNFHLVQDEVRTMTPFALTALRSCAYRGRSLTSLCIQLLDSCTPKAAGKNGAVTHGQVPHKALYDFLGLGLRLIQSPQDFLAVLLALQEKVFNKLTGDKKLEVGWSIMLVAHAFAAHRCGKYTTIDSLVLKIATECLKDPEFNQLLKRCAKVLSKSLKKLIDQYAASERRSSGTSNNLEATTQVNRAFFDALSSVFHARPGFGSIVPSGLTEKLRKTIFQAMKECVQTEQMGDMSWKVQVKPDSVEVAEAVSMVLVASCTNRRSTFVFDETAPAGKQLSFECLVPGSTVGRGAAAEVKNPADNKDRLKKSTLCVQIPTLLSKNTGTDATAQPNSSGITEQLAKDLILACDVATAAQNIPMAVYAALLAQRFHAVETVLELGAMGDQKTRDFFIQVGGGDGFVAQPPVVAKLTSDRLLTVFAKLGEGALKLPYYRNETTVFGRLVELRQDQQDDDPQDLHSPAALLLVMSYFCFHCPKDILTFLSEAAKRHEAGSTNSAFYSGILKAVIVTVCRMRYSESVQAFTTNDLKSPGAKQARDGVWKLAHDFYCVIAAHKTGHELVQAASGFLKGKTKEAEVTEGDIAAAPVTSVLVSTVALALRFHTVVDFWGAKRSAVEEHLQGLVSGGQEISDETGREICTECLVLLLGSKGTLYLEEELQGLLLSAVQVASKPLQPNPSKMPLSADARRPYEEFFSEVLMLSGIPLADNAKMKKRCHMLETVIVSGGKQDLSSRMLAKLTAANAPTAGGDHSNAAPARKTTDLGPVLEDLINFAPPATSVATLEDIFQKSCGGEAFSKGPTKICLMFDTSLGFQRQLKRMGADATTSKNRWFHQQWAADLLPDFKQHWTKTVTGVISDQANAQDLMEQLGSPPSLMGTHELYDRPLFHQLCLEVPASRTHSVSTVTKSTTNVASTAIGPVNANEKGGAPGSPGSSSLAASAPPSALKTQSATPALTAPGAAGSQPTPSASSPTSATTKTATVAAPAVGTAVAAPAVVAAATPAVNASVASVNVSATTVSASQPNPNTSVLNTTEVVPPGGVKTASPVEIPAGPRAFSANQVAWWEEGSGGVESGADAGMQYAESITRRLGTLAAVDADDKSATSYTDTTSATSDGRHGDPEGFRRSVRGHGHHGNRHGHRHGQHHHHGKHSHHKKHHHAKATATCASSTPAAPAKENSQTRLQLQAPDSRIEPSYHHAAKGPPLLTIPGLGGGGGLVQARAPLQLLTPPALNAQQLSTKTPDPLITRELHLNAAAPQLLTLDTGRFEQQHARLFQFDGAEMRPAGMVGPDGLFQPGAPVTIPPPVPTAPSVLHAPMSAPGANPPPGGQPMQLLTMPAVAGGIVNLDDLEKQRKKEKEERKRARAEKRAQAEREGKPVPVATDSTETTPERQHEEAQPRAVAGHGQIPAQEARPNAVVEHAQKELQMQTEDSNRVYSMFATEAPLPPGTTMVTDAHGQKHISSSPSVSVPTGAEGAVLTPNEQLGFRQYVDGLLSKSMFGTGPVAHPSIPNPNGPSAVGGNASAVGVHAGAPILDDYTARQQALFELQQASLQKAQGDNVRMFSQMIQEMRATATMGLQQPPQTPGAVSLGASMHQPEGSLMSSQSQRLGSNAMAVADATIASYDQKQNIAKLQNDVRDLQGQQARQGLTQLQPSTLTPMGGALTPHHSTSVRPLGITAETGVGAVAPTTDQGVQNAAANAPVETTSAQTVNLVTPAYGAGTQTSPAKAPMAGTGLDGSKTAAQLTAMATLAELQKMQGQLNSATVAAGAMDDAIAASRDAMARHEALSGMNRAQDDHTAAISGLKSQTASIEHQLRSELPPESRGPLYNGENMPAPLTSTSLPARYGGGDASTLSSAAASPSRYSTGAGPTPMSVSMLSQPGSPERKQAAKLTELPPQQGQSTFSSVGSVAGAPGAPTMTVSQMPRQPSASEEFFNSTSAPSTAFASASAPTRLSVSQLLQKQNEPKRPVSASSPSKPRAHSPAKAEQGKNVTFGTNTVVSPGNRKSSPGTAPQRPSSAGRKTSPATRTTTTTGAVATTSDAATLYSAAQPRLSRTVPSAAPLTKVPPTKSQPAQRRTSPGQPYAATQPGARPPPTPTPSAASGVSTKPSTVAKQTTGPKDVLGEKRRAMMQKHAAVRLADVDSRLN